MAKCPNCGNDITESNFPDVTEGESINCPSCGTELEVINLEPFEVDFLEEK